MRIGATAVLVCTLMGTLGTLGSLPAAADVRLVADDAIFDEQRTATWTLGLESGDASVGGVQADVLFDRRAVRLERASRCTIEPSIGDRLPACEDDPPSTACKALTRNLVSCGEQPGAPGCAGQPNWIDRLRIIIAATTVPNDRPLPVRGALLHCTFDLVDELQLPTGVEIANGVASDPVGNRLAIAPPSPPSRLRIDPDDPPPSATSAPTPSPSRTSTRLPSSTPSPSPTTTATPVPPVELIVSTPVAVDGRARVEVRLVGHRPDVGGVQLDVLFDSNVVALRSLRECRVAPALADSLSECDADPEEIRAPCKTLSLRIDPCGGDPPAHGCPERRTELRRLRAILAATARPNFVPLDDGLLFTCDFDVVDAQRLPAHLATSAAVASDVWGGRLPVRSSAGGVLDGGVGPPAATWTPAPTFTATETLTPTVTWTPRPTRTRRPTRTKTITPTPRPTFTPTISRTPTISPTPTASLTPRAPRAVGFTCLYPEECFSGNCVDRRCCSTAACAPDSSCGVGRHEGQCMPLGADGDPCDYHRDCLSRFCAPVAASDPLGHAGLCLDAPFAGGDGAVAEPELPDGDAPEGVRLRLEAVEIDPSTHAVDVLLESRGYSVGGVQIDLLFDRNEIVLDRAADCVIDPAIGTARDECDVPTDEIASPCKTLTRDLTRCGERPRAPGCDRQGPEVDRVRLIFAATAVPNNQPIPDESRLATCLFRLPDESTLPAVVFTANVISSDPFGHRQPASAAPLLVGAEPLPTPEPREPGAPCVASTGCASGHCVDRVCCAAESCPRGTTCSVLGSEGSCTPPRSAGSDCLRGSDCASGICALDASADAGFCTTLHRATTTPTTQPTSSPAAPAPAPATPTPLAPGRPRCAADNDCPEGLFCNQGVDGGEPSCVAASPTPEAPVARPTILLWDNEGCAVRTARGPGSPLLLVVGVLLALRRRRAGAPVSVPRRTHRD